MRLLTLTGAVATALLLAGCGPNDYAPQTGSSAADIFAKACASCHGDDGNGKMGMLLKVKGIDMTEAEIVDKITNGSSLMPAFPNIGDAEKAALAQYLKQ